MARVPLFEKQMSHNAKMMVSQGYLAMSSRKMEPFRSLHAFGRPFEYQVFIVTQFPIEDLGPVQQVIKGKPTGADPLLEGHHKQIHQFRAYVNQEL